MNRVFALFFLYIITCLSALKFHFRVAFMPRKTIDMSEGLPKARNEIWGFTRRECGRLCLFLSIKTKNEFDNRCQKTLDKSLLNGYNEYRKSHPMTVML